MPRIPRVAPGGLVYHVINRANARTKLFKTQADFLAFQQALIDTHERLPVPILAWAIMDDHWHLVLRPRKEAELARFVGRITLVHAMRSQVAHKTIGRGHVYQGRFKSFMVQEGKPLLSVLKFVESNGLRSKKAKKAQDYRWTSLHTRLKGPKEVQEILAASPTPRPKDWTVLVNKPQSPEEEKEISNAIRRQCPYGDAKWVQKMVAKYGLESTLRPRGRQPGWRKPKPTAKKKKR
jgi:putative transposase